ncbi:MAG TPA: hypothetical protein VF491_05155 [Vicinamibacterales bacterium]
MRHVSRGVVGLSFLLFVVFFSSTPAMAQDAGIRGGISVDPDQFYFGGHFETAPLVDHVYFRPNLEIGFGDDLTLLAANMEFVYKFTTRRPWNLYAGAGPSLNVFMPDEGDSDTDAGLNILVGVENSRGLFFEFKIGAIDSPDFKFGVGWTFR